MRNVRCKWRGGIEVSLTELRPKLVLKELVVTDIPADMERRVLI